MVPHILFSSFISMNISWSGILYTFNRKRSCIYQNQLNLTNVGLILLGCFKSLVHKCALVISTVIRAHESLHRSRAQGNSRLVSMEQLSIQTALQLLLCSLILTKDRQLLPLIGYRSKASYHCQLQNRLRSVSYRYVYQHSIHTLTMVPGKHFHPGPVNGFHLLSFASIHNLT